MNHFGQFAIHGIISILTGCINTFLPVSCLHICVIPHPSPPATLTQRLEKHDWWGTKTIWHCMQNIFHYLQCELRWDSNILSVKISKNHSAYTLFRHLPDYRTHTHMEVKLNPLYGVISTCHTLWHCWQYTESIKWLELKGYKKKSITVCTAIHEMDTYVIATERTSNENVVGLFYMQTAFPVTHAFCSGLRSGV